MPISRPLAAAFSLVAALTAVRLIVLFVTPLELYPDEAQYWLWSRELAFGYFSKPPMIAWLIALTTAIGGDGEPWVRISAVLLHVGAPLALYGVGARLYGGWAGFWAAALYSLMPGVQLSAGVIATDAPLLLCLSLALLAYVTLLRGGGVKAAAALGLALGAATLSKYAALYFGVGLVLHAFTREGRAAWTPVRIGAAAAALLAVLGPNLAWNALHGFSTVSHTVANADLDRADRFNPDALLEFVGEQFGVFGPVPFAVLLGGAVRLGWRRRLLPADLMLLGFALPPLLLVAGQAFLTRANANWAAAAYVPASVLVAAWLVRWSARRTLSAAVLVQSGIAALFLVGCAHPPIADAIGLAAGFKRARGWETTTRAILQRAASEPGLTAIAVDDRFYFNALAYYGRETLARPGAPPLRMWVRERVPQNQAEVEAPLRPARGDRVLAVSGVADFRGEMQRDFIATSAPRDVSVRLDGKNQRAFRSFIGEGFRPRPRDPVSGLPTPP